MNLLHSFNVQTARKMLAVKSCVFVCVCVCFQVRMCYGVSVGQRRPFGGRFSFFTMWVPEIDIRFGGKLIYPLSHLAFSQEHSLKTMKHRPRELFSNSPMSP